MKPSNSNKEGSSIEIVILHNGDQHLCFENREVTKKIKDEYIKKYGNDHVFLLNTGDIFPYKSFKFDNKGITIDELINWMNESGYNAMTLGNHDYLNENISYCNCLVKANIPILCANFHNNNNNDNYNILPHISFEVCGKKIIIFGISRLRDTDPLDDIINFKGISDLRKKADIFIALTHIGINRDERLANKLPKEIAFDIIIGGHTHDTFFQEEVNGVFISHALNPNYLGRLIVNIDNSSKIKIQNGLISLRKYDDEYCNEFRKNYRTIICKRRELCQETKKCWDLTPKDDDVYKIFIKPHCEKY